MVTKDLKQVQGQFKVSTPTGEDACDIYNNETGEVILEEGKSYSQTVTLFAEATKEQMNAFLEAVLSLCAGVREAADGVDLDGMPVVTKKISSTYMLIQE